MAKETSSNYEWFTRATKAIHHGALTNSKRAEMHIKGVWPTHITKGFGPYLYDTSGKQYIDFICGLGANLLGYANNQINKAIKSQLDNGNIHSLPSTLEVVAAEKLKELFPFTDKWRFLKTGSDACDSAIKIARSYQAQFHKKTVLSEGYHGHDNMFVSMTPPHHGVLLDPYIVPLKDNESLIQHAACVIVEPIITDISEDRIKWLLWLREECTKAGCLLIFDEVITGFRFPKFSFSEYSGIKPDIVIIGKAMAGGHALSAIGTSSKLDFNQEWFVSSTFAGETIAFAAFLELCKLLDKQSLTTFFKEAQEFQDELNKVLPQGIFLEGYGTRGSFKGDENILNLFKQEACRAGMLFGPSYFYSYAHKPLQKFVLNSVKDLATRINNNEVTLIGEAPQKPYAEKVRSK